MEVRRHHMRMAVQQIKENPFFKDPPVIICAENAPGLAYVARTRTPR